MTISDFRESSTDLSSEQALNEALADIERAFKVFDQLVEKNLRAITQKIARSSSADSRFGRLPSSRIGSILRDISLGSSRVTTVFNPHESGGNRFPMPQTGHLTDMASILQRIMTRNL